MISRVMSVDPYIHAANLGANGDAARDDLILHTEPLEIFNQPIKILSLRFKSEDLVPAFESGCKHNGGVTDVGSDIQQMTTSEEFRTRRDELSERILEAGLVKKVGMHKKRPDDWQPECLPIVEPRVITNKEAKTIINTRV